jgi:hypothetical protein
MLTKNEITTLNLSPTKKDFVQIWNELLEVAGKLSERWDPTSTNESDPGIVILKALTGIADKLNYNIDKNTLEAFMPTAAQEDSMRKLCDMLGYNIKYYRSAETTATIKYYNSEPTANETEALESGLLIPKFTVLTNADQDISYFTIDSNVYPLPAYIYADAPTVTVRCMEGQIVKCESTSDNNVITASQISENNRFYMPEATIAENGIFVYNVSTNMTDGTPWEKVDNLNIQSRGSRVFKFGYDSYEGRPYIEFPEDYSELIKDGLFIYYARTSGVNGNISARTLSQLELPNIDGWDKVSADSFSVENAFSATTGANVETISQSYKNFKKTIGTFDTLVTCRDYMNKIYMMTSSATGKYLVSNILATDIRTDINRAATICSCDDAGIFYKDTPLTKSVVKNLKKNGTAEVVEVVDEEQVINHFDLVLYPFKSYNQIRGNVKDIQEVYDASFSYSSQNLEDIKSELDKFKTIAHNVISPRKDDIISINNYLRLNAIINTHSKITTEEGTLIKENIKIALANAFNMRELDFGEEIPFDSIVDVIEKADSRIRVVSLAEPALYTTFSVLDGFSNDTPVIHEYAVASDWLSIDSADATGRFDYSDGLNTFDSKKAKQIYNKLAVRNILAGRIPLFKYNDTFKTSFSEGAYRVTEKIAFSQLPNELKTEEAKFAPTVENPFTVKTVNDVLYTGQLLLEQADNQDTAAGQEKPAQAVIETVYTKTYVPEKYKDNIITKELGNNITNIKTHCELPITAEQTNGTITHSISDVTLAAGEIIKFRAPNFITTKTFPAYVNYHLNLNKDTKEEPENAEAYTLFDLLNKYHNERGAAPDDRRQSVLSYFSAAGQKKTFTLTQKVSKKTENEPVSIDKEFTIDNSLAPTVSSPEEILAMSGFVKLVNHNAKIALVDAPAGSAAPEIDIPDIDLGGTSFIVNSGVFTSIKQAVDEYLEYLNDNTPDILPTDYDWTIAYEFEYVPFNAETLTIWKNFVKVNGRSLFGFTPAEDNAVLWHASSGGYSKGKNVLSNTAKLLPFTSGDFGFIESAGLATRLSGIYVAETLGKDQKSNYISNNEEYELQAGEYLCIEYTPSTTTADGTATRQESVKEIFGPKTIIRPSGFENGLIDSTAYASEGHSAHKKVKFDIGSTPLTVFSLGASEQIEIRDFAKVIINKDTFASTPAVYVYKNFNDCPELEEATFKGNDRINNSYTLKDGEYIFYTDKNKTEFAYFTSGTEVTLFGDLTLPKFDKIDLNVIFDSGTQEIPWAYKELTGQGQNQRSIMFQEFQYITLGVNDTLKKLTLATDKETLDENWQKCISATYIPAGGTEEIELQKITTATVASVENGWEVCSMLELNVSPDNAQTLRRNEKIKTSITLQHENGAVEGVAVEVGDAAAENAEFVSEPPLSFKVNLPCQSTNKELSIADLYSNPNNLKGFELKVFAEETPAVVKTLKNSLIPYRENTAAIVDMANLDVTQKLPVNEFGNLWKPVPLPSIAPADSYDNALKLSVSILPDTYGIFSIYIDYRNSDLDDQKTWIEILPGVSTADFELFNVEKTIWTEDEATKQMKLMLNPGINCIRINKTNTIYIKTKAVDGALYFDNIRLVDCKPIEYIKDGQKTTRATLGLNLDQLGYLDTSNEDTFNVFDSRIRQKLKSDFTIKALSELDGMAQTELKAINSLGNELLASKTQLQTLVSFLNQARQEIEMLPTDTNNLTARFEKYNEIVATLEQEEALQAAIVASKNQTDLETSLSDLLKKLVTADATEQELLDELEALKKLAIYRANIFDQATLTAGDIEADFKTAADATSVHLVNDLKLASIKQINADYAKKLNSLNISEIEPQAKYDLLDIFDKLNAANHADLLAQIRTLIDNNKNSLSDATTEITGIASNGLGVNYTELTNKLITLRNQLSNTNIRELVSQIEFISNSSTSNSDKYIRLVLLVDELQLLLDKDATAITGNYASLINSINAILVKTQSKTDSVYDSEIHSATVTLATDVTTVYIDKLKNIITDIQNILSTLATDANAAIDKLKASGNEAITVILGTLASYADTRSTDLASVAAFATGFNVNNVNTTTLPYADAVIKEIWPIYMKRSFIAGVDKLYKDVYAAIVNPGAMAILDVDASFYTTSAKETPRKVLVKQADIGAFQRLFYRANNQIPENIKNSARVDLINELYALILPSTDLTSAMTTIKTDESASMNAVLCRIIAKLQSSPTLVEKQDLIKELIDELEDVIKADTELANISAKLLCPSILQFEKEFNGNVNDAFYSTLKTVISNKKDELLAADDYSAKLTEILAYLSSKYTAYNALLYAIEDDSIAEFTGWDTLLTVAAINTTLLTTDFIAKLAALRQSLDVRDSIIKIKDCKLLTILKDENLVVAWQDTNGNWLDSYGNYYQKFIDGTWKAYPINGTDEERNNWLDAGSWQKDDKWRTYGGLSVNVNMKRVYIEKQGDVAATTLWVKTDAPDDLTSAEAYNDYVIKIQNTAGDWFINDTEVLQVNNTIKNILSSLLTDVNELGSMTISAAFKDAYRTIILEEQLLAEIRDIDKNRNFYYNSPIEANVAIDFNVGDETASTLMNPAINYDINNVNNNFVISKIDINYLTNGLQIARSSRLS